MQGLASVGLQNRNPGPLNRHVTSHMATLTPEGLASYMKRDAHLIYEALDILQANGKCPPGLEWLRSWSSQQVLEQGLDTDGGGMVS